MNLAYNVIVFNEGPAFIAYSPLLDISSCGKTPNEAKRMLKDAVKLFLEETEATGRQDDLLAEAGYRKVDGAWVAPAILELCMAEQLEA